jgi:hypothetical protein
LLHHQALKGKLVIAGTPMKPIPGYSTDWFQGGPIIEREKISLIYIAGISVWKAIQYQPNADTYPTQLSPMPLIAAMRCYVASKLGDTVDIPEELL